MAKGLYIGVLELTNLCPAIDGANGFTVGGGGTMESSSTHTKYSSKALKLNAVEGNAEVYATSQTTIPLNPEHIYYVRVEGYQEAAYGTAEIYWPVAEPHIFNVNVGSGRTWNLYSVVTDRASFNTGNYSFRLDFNSMHNNYINSSIWYDGWMIIDLTEAFGTGNEPTQEWCDENISYFVGTKALQVRNLNGVARKAKKAYIGVLELKNLIPSLDSLTFGLNGGSTLCEMSTSHVKYSNSTLCITGNSGDNEEYGVTTTKYNLDPTHIYYACFETYQENQLGSVDFFWPPASPSLFGSRAVGSAGQWNRHSIVTNRSTFTAGEYSIRLDFNNGGTEGKIWFDGIMLIDLTEAFGAGNEPDWDWCMTNIPYFTGTYAIKSQGLSGFTRKIKKGYIGVGGVARPFFSSEKKLEYYGLITPLSSVLTQHASASIENYALFAGGTIGGTGDSKRRNTVNVYDCNLTKTTATELSSKRYDLSGGSNLNYAIFAGGNNGNITDEVDAYDLNLVRTIPQKLSTVVTEPLSARAGEYLVIVGGTISSYNYKTTVDAYDSNLVHITDIATSNNHHEYGASTTLGDYSIFAGHYSKSNTAVDVYDSNLVKIECSGLSAGRYFNATGTAGQHVIVAGGTKYYSLTSSITEDTATVEAYNSSLVKVSNLSSLSVARGASASVSTDDYFIIAGGNGDDTYGTVDTFNNDLLLSTQTPLSTPRMYAKGAKVGNYVLIAGGEDSDVDEISSVEAYIEI